MVKIITDTTSVLPKSIAESYDIAVIPQIIHIDEDTFYEGIDIDVPQFLQRLQKSRSLPKTAAPPPELFIREFEKHTDPAEPIVCIHPSSEVSGTVRSATIAAQDFPHLDIRVIDTRVIASPLATLVILAAQWAQQGLDADEIVERLKSMYQACQIFFLVDTLEYLAKGGRIGGAAALVGSMLQIKPILTFVDGRVEAFEKERTHKRALEKLISIVKERIPKQNQPHLSIMHAGIPAQAEEFARDLANRLSISEIPIYEVPPAIITHGGPGILGVAFFTKSYD